MEESDNINKYTEENNKDEDENETNSKNNLLEPDMKSDNMKDLKSLDFNSADDVRQTLKSVFTSKMPNLVENNEDSISQNNDCGNDLLRHNSQQEPAVIDEKDDCKLKNDKNINILQSKKSTELRSSNKSGIRKRRGRPPKTGPSKRIKRQSVSTMYIGKLTNIVFLRRGNESDSDVDSVLF
ncbi:unnamed protein product [Euphydryas editha]|uniref:Uncharacterized protein n=1 Tax=Euphydryas editha TaxID=104508 RepID=A0AAU9TTJ5_EUPED|nr:unnamed protein product [Euphydryas editha]